MKHIKPRLSYLSQFPGLIAGAGDQEYKGKALIFSMASLKEIGMEIERIKERNRKVEADKAWETSLARKLIIAVFTYLVISVFLYYAMIPDPFTNAIVPAAAFFLSTLSLPFLKEQWIRHIYKK